MHQSGFQYFTHGTHSFSGQQHARSLFLTLSLTVSTGRVGLFPQLVLDSRLDWSLETNSPNELWLQPPIACATTNTFPHDAITVRPWIRAKLSLLDSTRLSDCLRQNSVPCLKPAAHTPTQLVCHLNTSCGVVMLQWPCRKGQQIVI